MGSSHSYFGLTREILDEYEELTYLSKAEILSLLKSFAAIDQGNQNVLSRRVSFEMIMECYPQIKYNPFRDRLCKVFSSERDGRFSFEDMLDLYSAMSELCPEHVKAAWAFRIFDFDEDNQIGKEDLIMLMDRLTGGFRNEYSREIEVESKQDIADILLRELDIESNGRIGQLAFEHGVGRMSEFPHSFCFRT